VVGFYTKSTTLFYVLVGFCTKSTVQFSTDYDYVNVETDEQAEKRSGLNPSIQRRNIKYET